MNITKKDVERFWPKVEKTKTCWNWIAAKNYGGYGMLMVGGRGGKALLAHRISYFLKNKKLPINLCVLHRCDNPACVRPNHLFLGTYLDNARDRKNKGRNANFKGENNPRTKLKNSSVLKIKKLLKIGITHRKIAHIFRTSIQSIDHISTGYTWKNL